MRAKRVYEEALIKYKSIGIRNLSKNFFLNFYLEFTIYSLASKHWSAVKYFGLELIME